MDETGLVWKCMPKSTYIFKSTKQARGWKADKNRFTAALTVNAAGTCKMKPFVVHTAAKPHCYRNLANMDQSGVYWRKGGAKPGKKSSKGSAWMSGVLAVDWFDRCFIPDARKHCRNLDIPFKVLLLLDNAPCHPKHLVGRSANVTVVFLPANTTSLIQPLDQEVIASLKFFYQRLVYQQMLHAIDSDPETLSSSEKDDDAEAADEDDPAVVAGVAAASSPAVSPAASPSSVSAATPPPIVSAATPSPTPGPSTASPTPGPSSASSTSPSSVSSPASPTPGPAPSSPTPGPSAATTTVPSSVTHFWKLYNIRSAINNFLVAWGEVTVASINHAWRRVTPQLCVTRTADCQSAAAAADATVRVARTVPGCEGVTLDEVMEQARDVEDTSVDTIAQEVEEQEQLEAVEQEQQQQEAAPRPLGEPTTALLSKILSTTEAVQALVWEDPVLSRSQEVVDLLKKAVDVYGRMHSERVSQQRQCHHPLLPAPGCCIPPPGGPSF